MEQNSTTIFIESESGDPDHPIITPIPWRKDGPDFKGIEGRTLSVLQSAYESQKENIIVIPDAPEIQPLADWGKFIGLVDSLFEVGLQANYPVFTQIFNMLLQLRDKNLPANDSSIEWRNFAFNYGLGKSAFNPAQIAQIEAAFVAANIPVIK